MVTLLHKVYIKTFKKTISLTQLINAKTSNKPLRLVIGSGYTIYKDWIITDINTLNITNSKDWNKYFNINSISSILAEHVLDELSFEERNMALQNIFNYLRSGGNFRIAVPDGYHPDPNYINYVKPGGTGSGAEKHKVLYNYNTLSKILKSFGFTPQPLEYFDESGKFHFNTWDSNQGLVKRSVINDKRNVNGNINYSSLIIDAIK
jgi:predicted SAM-dependent methyltransferase